jgi:hypothetical protein
MKLDRKLRMGMVGGGPFSGTIDDVMIFNRALTASEVNQLYLAGR